MLYAFFWSVARIPRENTVYKYFCWLKNDLFGEVTSVIKW